MRKWFHPVIAGPVLVAGFWILIVLLIGLAGVVPSIGR